jgi:hypothetical protein
VSSLEETVNNADVPPSVNGENIVAYLRRVMLAGAYLGASHSASHTPPIVVVVAPPAAPPPPDISLPEEDADAEVQFYADATVEPTPVAYTAKAPRRRAPRTTKS